MGSGLIPWPWALPCLILSAVLVCCGAQQTDMQDIGYDRRPRKTTTPEHAVSLASLATQAPAATGYNMNVTSTGLAVLDSTMFFQAQLIPDLQTHGSDSDRFIYQWTNTATRYQFQTSDGLESNVSVIFPSQNVTAGEYLMVVAVYRKDDRTTIVAFQTHKFKLTQELNGLLTVSQRLDYQRDPNIFSTKKLLTLTAAVHDLFLQSDLTFDYFWFKGEGILGQTKQPNCLTTVPSPANTSLASFICVRDRNQNQQRTRRVSQISTESWTDDLPLTMNKTTKETLMLARVSPCVASGMFEQDVAFKDPVQSCQVSRVDMDPKDRGISIKKSALLNVTCLGSTPSSVCTIITSLNSSLPPSHICKPESFVDALNHQVEIQLKSTGWSQVYIFIYNEVSRYQVMESFYGYDPDSMNVPALAVPLVFGVLGLVIIAVTGVYLVHRRRKSNVEVADFDFHPTLTSSQTHDRIQFARIMTTIKCMFHRDQYATEHKHPLLRRPAAHFEDNDSSQFYDSL